MAERIPVGGQLESWEVEVYENGASRLILTDKEGRVDSYRLKPGAIEEMAISILSLTLSTETEE